MTKDPRGSRQDGNGRKQSEVEQFWDDTKFPDGKQFFDYEHKESGAKVLKAQHPEFETWSQGIHARSGVSCADCHMPSAIEVNHACKDILAIVGLEEPQAAIIDDFYAHLAKFPDAVKLITDAGSSIEKLKKTNPGYFTELFRAEFDEQYYESRLQVGYVHAKIGITPIWFFGAMSTYLDHIYPLLAKRGRLSPDLGNMLKAFGKAINLDTEVIMEAYIEFGFIAQIADTNEQVNQIVENLAENARQLLQGAEESGRATT